MISGTAMTVQAFPTPGTATPDDVGIDLAHFVPDLLRRAPADADVATLMGFDARVHARLTWLRDELLGKPQAAIASRAEWLCEAQTLCGDLAVAYSHCARHAAGPGRARSDAQRLAQLAVRSFRRRADQIKWHAFNRTVPPVMLWEDANALYGTLEALGAEESSCEADPALAGMRCADAYGQCLLLSILNVGVLTSAQVELAHRWLAGHARCARVEPYCDPARHGFQIDLERGRGPERIAPSSAIADGTRFIEFAGLAAALGEARSKLYAGELPEGLPEGSSVALDFGAFLDLAERLWSPDWRRISWRATRSEARGESIEVAIGLERVLSALAAADAEPGAKDGIPVLSERFSARPQPRGTVVDLASGALVRWQLRDRSATGLGAVVPDAVGVNLEPGILVAYRNGDGDAWKIGTLVRRIRSEEMGAWLLGIRNLSDRPVHVSLRGADAPARAAIYAPLKTKTGRVDGLIVDPGAFGDMATHSLAAGDADFQVQMNRVLDRGRGWLRAGFEVLSKS